MTFLVKHVSGWLAQAMIIGLFASGFTAVRASELDSPLSRLQKILRSPPDDPVTLSNLWVEAKELAALAEQEEKQRKAELKQRRQTVPLAEMPLDELKDYHHEPSEMITSRERRGLEEIARLAQESLQAKSAESRALLLEQIREVQVAVQNNRRSPLPDKVGLITFWSPLIQSLQRDVGIGKMPATNLVTSSTNGTDVSRYAPQPSTFWKPPIEIAEQDLYAGFGRASLPRYDRVIATYHSPKTSAGARPGFEIEIEGVRYKVKFGEVHSEPFTARIFHALGYHVDPTDYTAAVRLSYDRRLFREFHLRKPLTIRIQPFGIPSYTVQLQDRFDPFEFIAKVVLKDGTEMSGMMFKSKLLLNRDEDHPETEAGNFRPEIEAEVAYLVTVPANIQLEDVPAKSIGPWEFEGLGHEHRRELRGAALLAGWLGWFDARFDNTRLRVLRTEQGGELQHFFTDLGSGMGGPHKIFLSHGEDPNHFAWRFTKSEIVRGPGRMTTPFRIVNFRPNVKTKAFAEMTVDDARWMARLIGQFTEAQLSAGLIGAGYDSSETRLYLEMLVSRRDHMIRDLKLAGEISLLRPDGVTHKFDYDPSVDGAMSVTNVGGDKISARVGGQIIRSGKLIQLVD